MHTSLYIHFVFISRKIDFFVSIEPLQLQYKFNVFTNFVSFSLNLRTLRNGKRYSEVSRPKMSVSAKNTANTFASREPERIEEPTDGISHELIE